eukprot:364897-Chlamydomonas_euryale.AAC.8
MAVQALKPRLDLLKKRFGDDKDRITKETNVMYEEAGVDPLAGCLPTLATIPVFIGLYSSLTNAATDGLFDTEGFFWIPSLAGPTTVAARQAGSGIAWLLPLVDGAPPIGWDEASRYLVLPALLLASMYASNAVIAPPIDPEDPNAGTSRALQLLLPLMVGFFSLNVPSGLTLYYFSNSVMTTAVQVRTCVRAQREAVYACMGSAGLCMRAWAVQGCACVHGQCRAAHACVGSVGLRVRVLAACGGGFACWQRWRRVRVLAACGGGFACWQRVAARACVRNMRQGQNARGLCLAAAWSAGRTRVAGRCMHGRRCTAGRWQKPTACPYACPGIQWPGRRLGARTG